MRELTPTAVFSESPGVGGSGGMFPVPFTVGEKKVPESGLYYGVQ